MKTIEYRTMDKASWEPGPWQDEPDKKQWQDEKTGLPCLIVRNELGALCGYVGVPSGHKFHGVEYDHVDIEHCPHGGLTFSGSCRHGPDESKGICHRPDPGEPDNIWWLGFDCAHCDDRIPNMRLRWNGPEIYRDMAYVTREVKNLAAALV